MTKNTVRRVKIARKLAIIVAAAPLFQLSQCQTLFGMAGQSFLNGLPSLIFSTFQSFLFAPLFALLGGGQIVT